MKVGAGFEPDHLVAFRFSCKTEQESKTTGLLTSRSCTVLLLVGVDLLGEQARNRRTTKDKVQNFGSRCRSNLLFPSLCFLFCFEQDCWEPFGSSQPPFPTFYLRD